MTGTLVRRAGHSHACGSHAWARPPGRVGGSRAPGPVLSGQLGLRLPTRDVEVVGWAGLGLELSFGMTRPSLWQGTGLLWAPLGSRSSGWAPVVTGWPDEGGQLLWRPPRCRCHAGDQSCFLVSNKRGEGPSRPGPGPRRLGRSHTEARLGLWGRQAQVAASRGPLGRRPGEAGSAGPPCAESPRGPVCAIWAACVQLVGAACWGFLSLPTLVFKVTFTDPQFAYSRSHLLGAQI